MEFREVPFSDLLSEVIDNRGKTCPTADTGIPLIATNCIRNELLYPTYDKVRFVSQDTYANWFRGHPRPGDILFVNKATPGRICLVPDPVDFCIAQDMVAVRADKKKIYPKFLFAVLRSPSIQAKIEQMQVGTLIPHFKKGDFDKLLLPVPTRGVQEFIGDIYFNLSAKIDLNRRTNETLEAMARAVFKSWFVDFDPVHAKSKGRQPDGMDAETASLFPSLFEESEIGRVPKGWKVQPLDAIANFLNGLACQKYPPTGDDSLPVIKIADLRNGVSDTTDRASPAVGADYIVKNGDVLFSWSGSLLVKIWTGGKGVLNQHLFKVTSDNFPRWFYYFWVREHLLEFQSIAQDKATTMGHIKRQHLTAARVVVPDPAVLKEADAIIAPLVERCVQCDEESAMLSEARDVLLPRLLSGEITVEKA